MDIGTHLFASWLVSSEVFRNRRERMLTTLVGVVPDIDGAGNSNIFLVNLYIFCTRS